MWTLLIALAASFVAGCSFHHALENQAVNFNRAVAGSESKTLLLNILRSADRQPRYFSALTQIRGNVSASLRSGFVIPLDGDVLEGPLATPRLDLESSPSFDLSVLDSKEFFRGIMSPVDFSTFNYYWDQGWSRQLLAYMLIRAIRVRGPDGEVLREIGNPPIAAPRCQQASSWKDFQEFVDKLSGHADIADGHKPPYWRIRPRRFGPALTQPPSLEALAALKESGLSIMSEAPLKKKKGRRHPDESKEKTRWFVTNGAEYRLVCGECAALFKDACEGGVEAEIQAENEPSEIHPAEGTRSKPLNTNDGRGSGIEDAVEPARRSAAAGEGHGQEGGKCTINLGLRSPEGMIYYLGELIRSEVVENGERSKGVGSPIIKPKVEEAPLFEVEKSQTTRSTLSVKYEQQWYSIPDGATISLMAIRLVRQTLALQKAREDLPTTRAVELIGQ